MTNTWKRKLERGREWERPGECKAAFCRFYIKIAKRYVSRTLTNKSVLFDKPSPLCTTLYCCDDCYSLITHVYWQKGELCHQSIIITRLWNQIKKIFHMEERNSQKSPAWFKYKVGNRDFAGEKPMLHEIVCPHTLQIS